MNSKVSAGLLMYRRKNNSLEFFLVHPGGPIFVNRDLTFWSIPKGESETGEQDLLEVAKREFEEETGTVASGEFMDLGNITQKSGKVVHAWAFEGELNKPFVSNTCEIEWPRKSGKMITIPEVDRGEFFDAETAKKKINPAQAELIDRLIQKVK